MLNFFLKILISYENFEFFLNLKEFSILIIFQDIEIFENFEL